MMKKLFLGIVVLLSPSFIECISRKDKMDAAIKGSDLAMVKKMLKRYGELELSEKQEFLEDAEDLWEARKKKISLSNPWDLSKFVGGLIIAPVMFVSMALSNKQAIRSRRYGENAVPAHIVSVLSTVGACYGLYLATQGYMCSVSEERASLARKVYDEIKKAQEKGSAALLKDVEGQKGAEIK